MQKTLTVEAIIAAFTAAGLAACGGSAPAEPAQSPVAAKEVPAAAAEPAPAAPAAAAVADPAAAPPAPPAAAEATAPKTDEKPADATAPKPASKKKAAGAKAGCGPGTCG
jgi:hypothetical protein